MILTVCQDGQRFCSLPLLAAREANAQAKQKQQKSETKTKQNKTENW